LLRYRSLWAIGLIPDRAFEVIGAGMDLRAIPLRDEWARRQLKIAVRDSGQLSGTNRLMLDHRQAAEGREKGGSVADPATPRA
jgi:hypothetical protein